MQFLCFSIVALGWNKRHTDRRRIYGSNYPKILIFWNDCGICLRRNFPWLIHWSFWSTPGHQMSSMKVFDSNRLLANCSLLEIAESSLFSWQKPGLEWLWPMSWKYFSQYFISITFHFSTLMDHLQTHGIQEDIDLFYPSYNGRHLPKPPPPVITSEVSIALEILYWSFVFKCFFLHNFFLSTLFFFFKKKVKSIDIFVLSAEQKRSILGTF